MRCRRQLIDRTRGITEAPTEITFENYKRPSGIDILSPFMLVNGLAVQPTYRYKGGDPSLTNWPHWTWGAVLGYMAGTAPTFNWGSPGQGTNDDSVLFNGGAYYQAASPTFGDLLTYDFVFEMVFRWNDGAYTYLDKLAAGVGYSIQRGFTNRIRCVVDGIVGGPVSLDAALINPNSWYKLLWYGTQRENSAFGSQIYINGLPSGAGANISGIGDTSSAANLTLGANSAASQQLNDGNIAYAAMYRADNWFQLGAALKAEFDNIAAWRFQEYTGHWPTIYKASPVPILKTRAYEAYLKKHDFKGSTWVNRYYSVGSDWIRNDEHIYPTNQAIQGPRIEPQTTNLIPFSSTLQNGPQTNKWFQLYAGDSFSNDIATAPDKTQTADALIISGDPIPAQHGFYMDLSLAGTYYLYSQFFMDGIHNWVCMRNTSIANCYAFFDIQNGVVGTVGAGVAKAFIEPIPYYNSSDNVFYRCWIRFLATPGTNRIDWVSCSADNVLTSLGDGVSNYTYTWGAQLEQSQYLDATSLVPTNGATATRLLDQFDFEAGDNIGGADNKEATIKAKIAYVIDQLNARRSILNISDNFASSDQIIFESTSPDTVKGQSYATAGNPGSAGLTTPILDGNPHDVVLSYKDNDLYVKADASESTHDTSCDMPDNLTKMRIGKYYNNNFVLIGLLSALEIWNKADQ